MNVTTKKVLHHIALMKTSTHMVNDKCIEVKGNYKGGSKGMEGEAFQQMLLWLDMNKLMPYFKVFICNQDSSVLHQLNTDPQTKGVQVLHNAGHMKKNLAHKLKNIFKTVKYNNLYECISQWFM